MKQTTRQRLLAILFLLVLIALGCKAPKTVYQNRIVYDTLVKESKASHYENVNITKIPPLTLDGTYARPCDENGKVKPINIKANTGKAKFRIWTENDSLKYSLEIDSLRDALVATKDSLNTNIKQVHSDKETKVTTIYKTKLNLKAAGLIFLLGLVLGSLGVGYIKRIIRLGRG